jgi:hypothetical protein
MNHNLLPLYDADGMLCIYVYIQLYLKMTCHNLCYAIPLVKFYNFL